MATSPSPADLVAEARSSLSHQWPLVGMVVLAAYFDWLLKGEAAVALLGLGLGLAPVLLSSVARPLVAKVGEQVRGVVDIPPAYRRLVAIGLPMALVYLSRWRGTQPMGWAVLTMALPLGTSFLMIRNRGSLERQFAPLFTARDRLLPRKVQLGLMLAAPILIGFALSHGTLLDLPAFFGASTRSRTAVGARLVPIVLGGLLSTIVVFLLAHTPSKGAPSPPAGAGPPPPVAPAVPSRGPVPAPPAGRP